MAANGKLRIATDGYLAYCPACEGYHLFDKRWTFNGNFDKPSFTPSMHVNAGQSDSCHSFLTDGKWHYCSDSKHDFAGQTVEMEDED